MLNRIKKITKIAILGAGALTFAALAYRVHNIHNTKVPNSKAIHSNLNSNQTAILTNNQNNAPNESKEHKPHQHDMDIRVLDMVGYPAVHGANILEPDTHHREQNKHPKNDNNQIENTKIYTTSQQQQKAQQVTLNQDRLEPISQTKLETSTQNAQKIQQPTNKLNSQKQQEVKKETKVQSEVNNNNQNNGKNSLIQKLIRQKVNYSKISQIPQLNTAEKFNKQDFVVIVSDMPYNSSFETQILTKLANTAKRRTSKTPLKIFRANVQDATVKQFIQDNLGAVVQEQTILFMKNPYEDKFINFDFDLYVKHNNLPSVYLSQLRTIQTQQQLESQLKSMTPNDAFILFAVSPENEADLAKKKLTAKYIEMQMAVNSIENIKIIVIDERLAKQNDIIDQNTKKNSLNLIRKHNQFTFMEPNRTLFGDQKYHVMQNISLYDKSRMLMIPRYLSKVQTFNSLKIDSPYVCSLTIDRNRISPSQERQILKIFAKLKRSEKFPTVSYVLKFGQTQFRGSKQQPYANKKWCIKMANLDQLDKQLYAHDIKKRKDLQQLKISQKQWLRDTYQYIYRQPEITNEGIQKFLHNCINGNQPQFYKTQAKYKLQGVHKLNGLNFNEFVFDSKQNKSHLVFEYSDHCQTCKVLSPIIQHFSYVCKKFPVIGTNVHAMNCDKNRVKGQPYSPYTPNLYFYSKNWKNKMPLRYPILQYINHTNVWGIYDFCTITDNLQKINQKQFNEHIKNVLNSNVKITDF